MEEIVKHINDTNASYRNINAGDAKNTDLFLDNEHYSFFEECGEEITVRFSKENLAKAILFIASILPRKFDQSATHKKISYSKEFVLEQLSILDGLFIENGSPTSSITQIWTARKNVLKKNGEIDTRFYFNGLLRDVEYTDLFGNIQHTKFTVRNYLAGGYSDLHIIKSDDGIFDIEITNTQMPYNDGKDDDVIEHFDVVSKNDTLQQIYYGAPGTGKSFTIDNLTNEDNSVRTTFHPDTDYASFVGAYKPTMKDMPLSAFVGKEVHRAQPQGEHPGTEQRIVYKYVPQAFLKAYVAAWSKLDTPYYLIIEEINRGNCAQIFGDLFQLLDRNNSGSSSYAINADEDIAKFLKEDVNGFASLSQEQRDAIAAYELVKDNGEKRAIGEKILNGTLLLLPHNLHIWATMNTSDQSLFPIDSAFKRRWNWKYVPIDTNPIDKNTKQPLNWKFEVAGNLYSWGKFLEKINPEIYSITESSDKQMGYFFAKADPTTGIISEEVFLNKVLFYLWSDVFKDYDVSSEIFKNKKENRSFRFTDFFEDAYALANFIENCGLEILNDNSEDYNPGDIEDSSDLTLYDEYQEYWGKVKDFINNKLGSNIASQAPLKQNWYNIHFGASGIVTFISRNTQAKHIRVGFSISKNSKYFDKFRIEEIKEYIPGTIERNAEKNILIVVAKTDVVDFNSQECMDWIADNVKQFYELGKKLISSNK